MSMRTGVAVLSLSVLAACGGGEGDAEIADPTTTAAPTTAVVDLGSGSGDSADGEAAAGTAIGPLAPGTYVSTQLTPELTFTVGEGWELAYENADEIGLFTGDAGTGVATAVNVFDVTGNDGGVLRPAVGEEGAPRGRNPFPEDYEAYLREHPELGVSDRRPTTVGGASGYALDVDLTGLPAGTCGGLGPYVCFSPAATSTGPIWVSAASSMTIHVLDVAGSTVLVLVADPQLHPGAAEELLASMRWTGS